MQFTSEKMCTFAAVGCKCTHGSFFLFFAWSPMHGIVRSTTRELEWTTIQNTCAAAGSVCAKHTSSQVCWSNLVFVKGLVKTRFLVFPACWFQTSYGHRLTTKML
eukprot:TRINITY_DN79541_c0_g1_i1.p2 TRINITY_DN79541_c0_g1~~TRINITY_DN79541_c0_g1_i1.p2  ORF type:complete len:105 (-),score=10.55 TRINITY_DN79541_c0_g1_i1:91-405(-)